MQTIARLACFTASGASFSAASAAASRPTEDHRLGQFRCIRRECCEASLPPSAPCPSLGTSIREPVGYRLQEVDLRYKGGQRSSDQSYGTPPALSLTPSRRLDLLAPIH